MALLTHRFAEQVVQFDRRGGQRQRAYRVELQRLPGESRCDGCVGTKNCAAWFLEKGIDAKPTGLHSLRAPGPKAPSKRPATGVASSNGGSSSKKPRGSESDLASSAPLGDGGPDDDAVSASPLVLGTVAGRGEGGACCGLRPAKQLIVALERMVHVLTWARLVRIWSATRFDDLLYVKPDGMWMEGSNLSLGLTRAKTSGAGEGPVAVRLRARKLIGGRASLALCGLRDLPKDRRPRQAGLPSAFAGCSLHRRSRVAGGLLRLVGLREHNRARREMALGGQDASASRIRENYAVGKTVPGEADIRRELASLRPGTGAREHRLAAALDLCPGVPAQGHRGRGFSTLR